MGEKRRYRKPPSGCAVIVWLAPSCTCEVNAYEITVDAGESLIKEAREFGTRKVLKPVDEYAPYWVTGGEVVYVHCRDDYDVEFVKASIAKDDALCGLVGNSCGFGIPEHGTLTLTMRCIKAR